MSIKEYVLNCLSHGVTAEETWQAAQEEFPFRVVGWNYVQRLARDYRLEHRNQNNGTITQLQ